VVSVADDIGMSQGKIMMAAARFGLGARKLYALIGVLWLLIAGAAFGTDVDCSSGDYRCVAPVTSDWGYLWGNYVVDTAFPSWDAAIADIEFRINRGTDFCVESFTTNNELPALSQYTSSASSPTGDWSVSTIMGYPYDIRWANTGEATVSSTYPCSGGTLAFTNILVERSVTCPQGFGMGSTYCYIATKTKQPDKSRMQGCPSCRPSVADPIDVADGFMWQEIKDIDGQAGPPLTRYYVSNLTVRRNSYGWPLDGFGYGWRTNYSRRIVGLQSPGSVALYIERPFGQSLYFTKGANGWASDVDVHSTLKELDDGSGAVTGWSYFDDATGDTEGYGVTGKLLSITHRNGRVLNLTYDANGLLSTVVDDQGRSLTFGPFLNQGNPTGEVQTVTDSLGNVYTYSYNTSSDNLLQLVYPDGSGVTYHYDNPWSAWGLTGWGYTAPGGSESRYSYFTYDSTGRAISSYEAGNVNTTNLVYNSNGTVSVTDQRSGAGTRTLVYAFNVQQGVAKLSGVTGACGGDCPVQSAAYDGNGNQITATDFNGITHNTTYSADGAGLPIQVIQAVGRPEQRTVQTDWNEALRLPTEQRTRDATGSLKAKENWVYNASGLVTARCEADPAISGATSYTCGSSTNAPAGVRQWSYSYCNTVDTTQCPLTGLLLAVDGPRTDISDITHYTFYLTTDESGCGTVGGTCHRAGDLYQVIDALGHVSTMVAYDKNGRLIRSQDSNNVITDLTYTPRGWLHTRSTGGATTTIDYDPTGTVHKITDPDGVYVTYTYDAAHRLTDITDALGNHIHYTLDAADNKTQEDTYDSGNTLRRTLSRSFNTLGQLTGVTDGLSHTVFNASYSDSYDANGNLVHTADGLGVQRKQGYDALNRLVSTIDNYNGTDTATQNTQATFAYDALDNLEGVTDPDGLSTTYDYDGLSNPKALHSPDTGTSSFQTDAAGNRIQQTDAKGIIRTTTYDAINRPVTVSYPDSTQNIAYHYDEADSTTGCSGSFPSGRLTRIVETAVTTTYCYDSHGNVTRKSQAQGSQVDVTSYTYTAADRLSSITTPSQTVTQYSRDTAGRISGVTVIPNGSTGQAVVSAISYLPFGPISSYTLGNGQTITRSYDANYALKDIVSPALNLHFARDVIGNITALSNSPGASPAVETYGYDSLYRLAGVNDSSGNAIEAYTYSKTGDRLSKAKAGGLATGAYGYQSGSHWLTSIGSAARTYDLNGNTIGSANAGETLGYGYNDRNRLTLVQRNQQTVATYVYNAMGERMAKAVTSPQLVSERFAYDEASQLVGEYGTTSRDYIWLDNLPVAVVDNGTTNTISYVHADGLGTPRAISDAVGNTIWQWAYQSNPFGEQQPTGSYVYNLRFPGQYSDSETGITYNVNRDYESATGRYLQPDLLGLFGGQPSIYAYVDDSPLGHIDPFGLAETTIDAAIEKAIASGDVTELETLLEAAGDDTQVARIRTAINDLKLANANKPPADVIKQVCTNSQKIAKGNDIRKVDELVQKFGGKAKDWIKKKGWDEQGNEWHWYENSGRKIGWKLLGDDDPF
jgi:RHS repeat-associated protein